MATDAHFSDILVPDSANLLNIGSTLRHSLDGVSGELELVLDVGGLDDLDARLRDDAAHSLLAKEVTVCPKSNRQHSKPRNIVQIHMAWPHCFIASICTMAYWNGCLNAAFFPAHPSRALRRNETVHVPQSMP